MIDEAIRNLTKDDLITVRDGKGRLHTGIVVCVSPSFIQLLKRSHGGRVWSVTLPLDGLSLWSRSIQPSLFKDKK